jgi:hypothetical protein
MNWKGCLFVLITVTKLSLVLVTIAKPLFGIKVVRALPNPVFIVLTIFILSLAAYSVNYNGHAEGRPINSIFYKLNLKDLEIHNKLPLEEHIYELEGVFASIPVISPPPVISHTMKGEFLI